MLLLITRSRRHHAPVLAQTSPRCDMTQYKAVSGLTAAIEQDALAVTWNGANGSELRARYAHRQRPARRARAGGEEERRAVGAARAESRARVLRQERRPAHDDAAGSAAHQSRRRHHAGGDREEQVVRVLGCAVRHSRRARSPRRREAGGTRSRTRSAGTGIAKRAGGQARNGASRPRRTRVRTAAQAGGNQDGGRDVQGERRAA